jgi:hypothetical protein
MAVFSSRLGLSRKKCEAVCPLALIVRSRYTRAGVAIGQIPCRKCHDSSPLLRRLFILIGCYDSYNKWGLNQYVGLAKKYKYLVVARIKHRNEWVVVRGIMDGKVRDDDSRVSIYRLEGFTVRHIAFSSKLGLVCGTSDVE